MVLAVTRGAAALRRCARESAVQGGFFQAFVLVIFPSVFIRSLSNLRYPLTFLRVLALGRAHEEITLILRLVCVYVSRCSKPKMSL